MPDPNQALPLFFRALAILAVAAGPIVLYWRMGKEPLLPQQGKWIVPWNGWAVLAVFIALVIVPALVQAILVETGFYRMLYGPDFPATNANDKQALHLRGLWSQTLAAPLIVLLILVGFRHGMNATSEQMGLSRKRLGANLALGYLGWLIVAPITFVVFFVAIQALTPHPDKHPLMDLGSRAGQLELAVFALQAAILWPLVEELLFRGLLLAWLIQEAKPGTASGDVILQPRHRGHLCVAAGLVLSLQSPQMSEALRTQRWDQILPNLGPFLFVIALLPFYLFLPYSKRVQRWTGFASPQTNQALFASAIFFAAVHSSVWPTPIPLLVLGIGLGWLALRTRSIVPSLVAHALFNGVAVIYQRLEGVL